MANEANRVIDGLTVVGTLALGNLGDADKALLTADSAGFAVLNGQPVAPASIPAVAGRYYGPVLGSTGALTALREYATLVAVPSGFVIDRIGINCTVAAVSSAARCVVRAYDGTATPGAVLLDPGADLDTTSTGVKEHTVSFRFPSTLAWLCLLTNASGTFTASLAASSDRFATVYGNATFGAGASGISGTLASYAVNATFAGGGAIASNGTVPLVRVRAA